VDRTVAPQASPYGRVPAVRADEQVSSGCRPVAEGRRDLAVVLSYPLAAGAVGDEVAGQPAGQAFQQATAGHRLGREAVTAGRVGHVHAGPQPAAGGQRVQPVDAGTDAVQADAEIVQYGGAVAEDGQRCPALAWARSPLVDTHPVTGGQQRACDSQAAHPGAYDNDLHVVSPADARRCRLSIFGRTVPSVVPPQDSSGYASRRSGQPRAYHGQIACLKQSRQHDRRQPGRIRPAW
jgi:hypothetical protein